MENMTKKYTFANSSNISALNKKNSICCECISNYGFNGKAIHKKAQPYSTTAGIPLKNTKPRQIVFFMTIQRIFIIQCKDDFHKYDFL